MLQLFGRFDERMRHDLFDGDALGRVDLQYLVEQVLELQHLLVGLADKVLVGDQLGQNVARRRHVRQQRHFLVLGDLVHLAINEVAIGVEVFVFESRSLDELVRHLAAQVHEQLDHVVVRLAREHDLARVQLEQCHGHRPQVDAVVIRQSENYAYTQIDQTIREKINEETSVSREKLLTDFGCTIESTDQVFGDLAVGRVRRGAEIAELEHKFGLVDEYVVRLDVGMQYLALLEQTQRSEQLASVGAHRGHVQAHILAVLFEQLAQVHAQRLEDQAQVLLVVEAREQSQAVELVLRIGLVQLAQKLELFHATLVTCECKLIWY